MTTPTKPVTVWLFPASYAPHLGGLETVVAQLAAGLQAEGHTVRVFAPRSPRTLPARERLNGIAVERWFFLWPLWADLQRGRLDLFLGGLVFGPLTLARLLWRLAREKPDVVNAHFANLPALFVALARGLRRFRFVLTLHGDDVEGAPHRSAFYRWLLRLAARRADVVTACSNYLLDQARALVPDLQGRSWPTPNGYALPVRSEPVTTATAHLVAVGRLVPVKGFDLLLQALPHLPSTTLAIVGAGPERAHLEELAQHLQVASRVRFLGALAHAEALQAMATSAVVVIPSRQEAFGLVALEAMALGKPIVASQVGGLLELLHEAEAEVVTVLQPTILAAAITSVLQQLEHNPRFGAKNQTLAARFTLTAMVARYVALYASPLTGQLPDK